MNFIHQVHGPEESRAPKVDVVIVGAGPAGLACAVELRLRGLDSLIFDKGRLLNSLSNFPTQMQFFTSPPGLEIGGLPLDSPDTRPGRTEVLNYYHRVAKHYELSIRQDERVHQIEGQDEAFTVRTTHSAYACRKVIIATGSFDIPIWLGIPGEDSNKVSHYYQDPSGLSGRAVVVIGGRNSAGTAALELNRAGVHVTLIHRGAAFTKAMKPWIREELEARIDRGEINALFSSQVRVIQSQSIIVETPGGTTTLRNDFVFALTGYKPHMGFLTEAGVGLDAAGKRPLLNAQSLESSRPGIYLAGVVAAGLHTNELNIEHAKAHARCVASNIAVADLNSQTLHQPVSVD